jgi:hypothetical protein
MPPVAEPRAFAVYEGKQLLLAFVSMAGPILSPMTGVPALLEHPAVRGQVQLLGTEPRLLPILQKAASVEALVESLKGTGLEVRETPLQALKWALKYVPLS